jgi:hypothetical protein
VAQDQQVTRGYGCATRIADLAAIELGKPQWLQGWDRAPRGYMVSYSFSVVMRAKASAM